MKYLIDKVNPKEAKRIYEIIDFFEKNPTITRENVDISHKMLIKFNDLMQRYTTSSSENLPVSYRMLCIHQMKWDSDFFCSHPAERNTNSLIYMKHVAFGEKHKHIIQLEKARKDVLQEYRKFRFPLFKIVRKIQSLFKQ